MQIVLKKEYWSKADAFLLPLTGLDVKTCPYELKSYLFWKDVSIEDYKLVVTYRYDNKEQFEEYCRQSVFPILDKKGYLIESYDIGNQTIFILDISEWAMDIEMVLAGRYSQITQGTKNIIQKYHYLSKNEEIDVYIYGVLYPKKELEILRDGNVNLTPIQYVSKFYEIDYDYLMELGEIGSKYDRMKETLLADVEDMCQFVTDTK